MIMYTYIGDKMKFNIKSFMQKVLPIIQIILGLFALYIIVKSMLLTLFIKIIAIVILFGLLFGITRLVSLLFKKKNIFIKIASVLGIVLIYGVVFESLYILTSLEGNIDKITGDKYVQLTSNFMVLSDSNITKLTDIDGKSVGLLKNTEDQESNIMPLALIKKESLDVEIVYAYSYYELVTGLLDGDFDVVVLPDDYLNRYDFEDNIIEKANKIISINRETKKIKSTDNAATSIKSGEPFNIVLIGTDSALETHHHNYDVLILLTFVPETKDLVVTSVYRATGMYSSCIGGFDLVNHNGWKGWGPSCLKKTIEDFFDVDISYYLMIDFQGFVDMVDTIGGIDADVLKDFCEQDSLRRFGDNLICLDAGYQHLNGEEALAFARHRKSYEGEGGVVRSKNHITVLKAIAKKLMTGNGLFKFNTLLDILQKNMETDMSKTQLYSLYSIMLDVIKDIDYDIEKVNIIPRSVEGYGEMLYSPAMNQSVGISLTYEKSYDNVYNTLQTVLYNKPVKPTYYSFELGEDPDYVPPVIKDDLREQVKDPRIMPDFVGKLEEEAYAYLKRYSYFVLTSEYVLSDAPSGEIISQSIPGGQGFDSRFRMTIKVSKGNGALTYTLPDTTGWDYFNVMTYINSKSLKDYSVVKYTPKAGEDYTHNEFVSFDENTITLNKIYQDKPVTFYIASVPSQVDDVPPTLTLKGSTTITIKVGETFKEPGFTAWDEVDWDYANTEVVTDGAVDPTLPGTYTITYSITNSKGLTTTKERTVIVE